MLDIERSSCLGLALLPNIPADLKRQQQGCHYSTARLAVVLQWLAASHGVHSIILLVTEHGVLLGGHRPVPRHTVC